MTQGEINPETGLQELYELLQDGKVVPLGVRTLVVDGLVKPRLVGPRGRFYALSGGVLGDLSWLPPDLRALSNVARDRAGATLLAYADVWDGRAASRG